MNLRKLRREFYLQKCQDVAKGLIGKLLCRVNNEKIYTGVIAETEAYLGIRDAASHAFHGITGRNEVMFSEGGIAYVYFTYGNHFCLNVVTGKKGVGEAVLIRALEPVSGIEQMRKNRGTENIYALTSGPGKLTKAFDIDKNLNGADLSGNEIFIFDNENNNYKIRRSPRIGITKNADKLLRFYAVDSPFVSGKKYKFTGKK